ncbi:MAG: hypothetical protein ABSG43_21840 [Solirubrobacteraceae bacterium]
MLERGSWRLEVRCRRQRVVCPRLGKVRLITRRAYGFHFAKVALALVMLTCGPTTLHLPHELHAPAIE